MLSPELQTRLLAGDDGAFEIFMREVQSKAMAMAMSVLHEPNRSEDVIQDCFLKFWKGLGRMQTARYAETYFLRMVINRSLDTLRKEKLRRWLPLFGSSDTEDTAISHIQFIADGNQRPDEAMEDADQRDKVREQLEKLPERQKLILSLRFFAGLQIDEIAESLRLHSGTVKATLHQGLKRFRALWEKEFGEEI